MRFNVPDVIFNILFKSFAHLLIYIFVMCCDVCQKNQAYYRRHVVPLFWFPEVRLNSFRYSFSDWILTFITVQTHFLPAGSIVGALYDKLYTQSSAPEDGRNYRPKQVEMIEIINKPLFLHVVGYLYYWHMGFNSVFKGLRHTGKLCYDFTNS